MKLDYSKYTYLPILGMAPNVKRESIPIYADHGVTFHKTELRAIVVKLAIRHPDWLFVLRGHEPVDIHVFCEEEYLGCVGYEYDYTRQRNVFGVENPRLRAARSSKRASKTCNSTTDMNKALRLVKENFYPIKIAEVAEANFNLINSGVHERIGIVANRVSYAGRVMETEMREFVAKNWGAFTAAYPDRADKNLPELLAKHNENFVFRDALSKFTGLYVVAHKDGYLVSNRVMGQISKLTHTQDFTSDVKIKLAMLKMVGDGELLPGVGIRINANLFYILPEVT